MAEALVILKPDAAHRLAVRSAVWGWLQAEREWRLHALSWFQPPAELIRSHYDFLQDRPFFPWLVDFMTALPVVAGRVEAEPDGLERMRYELGETRVHEARPGSLRERYGIGAGVNVLHISDSPASGGTELALWAGYLTLDAADARLEAQPDRPDHTFHLRSLASQYAAGIHQELAAQEIKRLLREESDLSGDGFEALTRVILGAFSP